MFRFILSLWFVLHVNLFFQFLVIFLHFSKWENKASIPIDKHNQHVWNRLINNTAILVSFVCILCTMCMKWPQTWLVWPSIVSQLDKQWMGFNEIFYGHYATAVYPKFLISNFLKSGTLACCTHELVRWECQFIYSPEILFNETDLKNMQFLSFF